MAATAGALAGAIVLYGIGRLLPAQRLERLVAKWGGLLHVKASDIARADGWFRRHGSATVFYCRMIPVVRSLISIPAGMSGMSMGPFLLYTTAGTLIWNTLLISAGSILGENWAKVVAWMDVYSNVMYVMLGVGMLGFVLHRILRHHPIRWRTRSFAPMPSASLRHASIASGEITSTTDKTTSGTTGTQAAAYRRMASKADAP